MLKLMMTYLTRAGGLTRGKERGYFLPMPHLLSAAPNSWHFCMLLEPRTKMLFSQETRMAQAVRVIGLNRLNPSWEDSTLCVDKVFIGPESDHWECLSLTHWLTHSCLVNLIDVTLACEDGNSKLVEVVTVVDVDDEDQFITGRGWGRPSSELWWAGCSRGGFSVPPSSEPRLNACLMLQKGELPIIRIGVTGRMERPMCAI